MNKMRRIEKINRYQNMFKKNISLKKGCFVPFLILGYPTLKKSMEIIQNTILHGADALEISIPFSDPIADGPIIQKANFRALQNNITIKNYFHCIKKIREQNTHLPIGLLIYANLILRMGIKKFYSRCLYTKIDSILIPDLPIEESNEFRKYGDKYKISSIYICPPNANTQLIKKISKYSIDYVYLVSRTGVTGINKNKQKLNKKIISKLKKYNSSPILNGFGITHNTNIKKILKLGISGIICGSEIISIINKYLTNNQKMFTKIKELCKNFKKKLIL
ncbi:tryptophan synthase subunit alpha [Buchnera aphidicola (Sipha maydis)]|nr:tryptophan synthase subunit alpha [Buchnera aphidicola]USS94313.1 tryptophan synthase subunit alpha [Buchnera aphidicola (Sipha maydis)]